MPQTTTGLAAQYPITVTNKTKPKEIKYDLHYHTTNVKRKPALLPFMQQVNQ
jgi:hypothetical protein